ncbi:MAG: FG-GAP repeat domain-containing protein [Planctomycetaceae bacterium]
MRSGDGVTTLQHVAVTGRVRQATIEQHATWRIRWQRGKESDATPRLARIEVADFEQTKIEHPQGKLFADCTESVLGGNDSYRKQFLRGMNHWFERIQDKRHFYLLGNPGLAVGDVNGDGLDDLYVCQEEGLPNRLFLQRKDGSARDVSAEWGVDWLHSSRGVLLVDLDNDGDQDLAVAMVGSLILAANDGRRFTIRAVLATDEDSMSLSSADYDGDGDLDLFVCAYFESGKNKSTIRGEILGGVAGDGIALGGGRNTLFRNDIARGGDWRFTDVTKASGVDVKNKRYSFASSWEDYDQDGDPDLYVVNDYGRNNLFRNDGGRFTDVTATAAAEDDAFGMAVTWGDYDRDGWMDLHVSNMFSSAGGRVTHSDRFRNVGAAWRNKLQRSARGNTLLRNTGTGRFTDVTDRAGIAMGRWAWSSNFVDVNNDGWDDILVANGFLTTDDTGDL